MLIIKEEDECEKDCWITCIAIKPGAKNVIKGNRIVSFEGDKGFLYKANLSLRTALKILRSNVEQAEIQKDVMEYNAKVEESRKLEEANKESATILDEAKAEASSLINQANSRADQIVDEAKEQAAEEAKKIKLSAEADIEQSANKAKDGLRDEVASLVIAGAQKILDKGRVSKYNKKFSNLRSKK
mgnify:CR=1 FL=1